MAKSQEIETLTCYHCGDRCPDNSISIEEKYFCCNGCKAVYEILSGSDLKDFYKLGGSKGLTPGDYNENEFAYLDDEKVLEKLVLFTDKKVSKIILYVPEIYCSACIWLLENLGRIEDGIAESKVNFLKKELSILYVNEKTSLRKIVELLTKLGYRPQLSLSDVENTEPFKSDKSLYIKLGIAGFAFGNIMLFALPDYLSGGTLEHGLRGFLSYVSLILGVMVLYSSSDYFRSAYYGVKAGRINIDLPISLGIAVLFLRSAYEIISAAGTGYIDSMSGLVFFLLIGKVFQQKTYYNLSFSRDYKSYFPLSVKRETSGVEEFITINDIKPGDNLIIRNKEIIPCDSVLLSENAAIDYSFVTGESTPVNVDAGEKIYAGGRLAGKSIRVASVKIFHQSYLTELWNNQLLYKNKEEFTSRISDTAAKYFTYIVLAISLAGFGYWATIDIGTAFSVFTSVLLVSCPCAIALTIPFTFGTVIRVFGNNNFFLKSEKLVETMAGTKSIVFDKTGTVTDINSSKVTYYGRGISPGEKILIASIVRHSTHPMSRIILSHLEVEKFIEINSYNELPGRGIEAEYDGAMIRLGSLDWIRHIHGMREHPFGSDNMPESTVFWSFGDEIIGYFAINSAIRQGLKQTLQKLEKNYTLFLISGDNDSDREALSELFPDPEQMKFKQMPEDKVKFVIGMQEEKEVVMMIGDGLNDAAALKAADFGIAVADKTSSFTPNSDAIISSGQLNNLDKFLTLTHKSLRTVYISYVISILYNLFGISLALSGLLSPISAAILMPVSSISIMLFTTSKVVLDSRRIGLAVSSPK